jgi:hypothetical protein
MRWPVILALALGASCAASAQAAPVIPADVGAQTPIVKVFQGCGPYGHRGPMGRCRPGGQWGGYNRFSCPPGWHIGPYGRKCWPNHY